MKLLFLFVFIIASISTTLFAQKEANIWYFGNRAGLDFNSGIPVVIEDGMMNNLEGVASISDNNGNILFYTDGMTIYNRNHAVMQNGSGLLGHSSSTQSGVIVPVPSSLNLYYVFTVDHVTNPGNLNYSIVDINAAGGVGAVVKKNVYIQNNSAEKISAVLHANKVDIWIVIHERHNSTYKSYLLTKEGLTLTIIISNTGPSLSTNGEQGCLKFSPDGKKLAMASYHNKRVDICNFDNASGVVKYQFGFNYPDATYGVEFSQDCKFLYVSISYDISGLYQVNLLTHSNTLIATPAQLPASLQLGPDGKIYVARYYRPYGEDEYLGVINSPGTEGPGCDYVDKAIHLGSGRSKMGLPTFIQSYFDYTLNITGTNECQGSTLQFNSEMSNYLRVNLDWMAWDFGDPLSNSNTSEIASPTHLYKNPGTYPVTFTVSSAGVVKTSSLNITVWPNPSVNLPKTAYLCPGQELILEVGPDINCKYLWNNSSSSSNIVASATGIYSVIKTDNLHGCKAYDTLEVKDGSNPSLTLPDSLVICSNASIILDAGNGPYTYAWNDLSTNPSLTINQAGDYWVKKTNNMACVSYDETNVSLAHVPDLELIADTMLCTEGGLTLSVSGFESYKWQDNSTASDFHVTVPGTYSVEAITSDNCHTSDEINIFPCCNFSILVPNVFTPNDDGFNDTFKPIITGHNKCKMSIANRWGAILFVTTDIDGSWDGRFENVECPVGVYLVLLEYDRCDEPLIDFVEKKFTAVTLLR